MTLSTRTTICAFWTNEVEVSVINRGSVTKLLHNDESKVTGITQVPLHDCKCLVANVWTDFFASFRRNGADDMWRGSWGTAWCSIEVKLEILPGHNVGCLIWMLITTIYLNLARFGEIYCCRAVHSLHLRLAWRCRIPKRFVPWHPLKCLTALSTAAVTCKSEENVNGNKGNVDNYSPSIYVWLQASISHARWSYKGTIKCLLLETQMIHANSCIAHASLYLCQYVNWYELARQRGKIQRCKKDRYYSCSTRQPVCWNSK